MDDSSDESRSDEETDGTGEYTLSFIVFLYFIYIKNTAVKLQ